MQVTLDPINWNVLTSYPSAADYFEWFYDLEDGDEEPTISCYEHGWATDSAIVYTEIAEALEYVLPFIDQQTNKNLQNGLMRLVSVGENVDEFQTSPASDYCYWISASPETTKDILQHVKNTQLEKIKQAFINHPSSDFKVLTKDFDTVVIPFVNQYIKVLELAVSNNFGVLGHCG